MCDPTISHCHSAVQGFGVHRGQKSTKTGKFTPETTLGANGAEYDISIGTRALSGLCISHKNRR